MFLSPISLFPVRQVCPADDHGTAGDEGDAESLSQEEEGEDDGADGNEVDKHRRP